MAKNIAILSGKGGTGKTMLSINLAAALHNLGENTLLIDANLQTPHIGVSLGTGMHINTLHDVLLHRISHMSAVYYHDSGLKIVPGALRQSNSPLDITRLGVYKHSADYVLYDCPPTEYSHVWAAANQALIITQAQFPALADAMRVINEVRNNQDSLLGVVLNKPGKHDLSLEEVETFLGVPVIASLPHDNKINYALKHRVVYCNTFPKRKAALAIKELAHRIAGRPI